MAQRRSPEIVSMIDWIWTSRLSIKNTLNYSLRVVEFIACIEYFPLFYQIGGEEHQQGHCRALGLQRDLGTKLSAQNDHV